MSPPQWFPRPASWPLTFWCWKRCPSPRDVGYLHVPILVFLGLSVVELFLMYATDVRRQTWDKQNFNPSEELSVKWLVCRKKRWDIISIWVQRWWCPAGWNQIAAVRPNVSGIDRHGVIVIVWGTCTSSDTSSCVWNTSWGQIILVSGRSATLTLLKSEFQFSWRQVRVNIITLCCFIPVKISRRRQ